ncbi:MAG: pseudouridine synthase, partial [Cyclobacteriaceae bacterium]
RTEDGEDKPRRFGKPSGFSSSRPGKPNRFGKRSQDADDKPKRSPRGSSDTPTKYRSSRPEGKSFERNRRRPSDDESPSKRPGKYSKEGPKKFEGGRYAKKDSRSSSERPFSGDKRERSSGRFKPESLGFTKKGKSIPKKGPSTAPEYEARKDEALTRLNKHIANSGMGSRREADEMIKKGLISVNGITITEMGHKVKPGDVVRYEDKVLKAEKPVYVLLNKPKGFITTTVDPKERKTVMNLVANACKERLYPVGRLDRNTTGLLLLTNDGDLAAKLTHPSYNTKKIYKVELDRALTKNDFQKIVDGVRLEEGKAIVDDLAYVSDDKKSVGIELHIGWNRIIRRIFESLEYEVVKLDRVIFAGLDKKDLPRGEWRFLKPEEVVRLKHFK